VQLRATESAAGCPLRASTGSAGPTAPENDAARRRTASRGGKAKADREVQEVKAEIRNLIARVRDEGFDPTAANAINRLYNTLLAYILAERGIYREEDLAVRIRELGGQ
jgi:hypothetical protein